MLDFLKSVFNGKALTFEEFEASVSQTNGVKLANLADGGYVSASKYNDDIKAKEDNIKALTTTIKTRDDDLSALRSQLENAGTDQKLLSDLNAQIKKLEADAQTEKENYENALKAEKYKGACKDFASALKFNSTADKNWFISSMIAENMEMKDGQIVGADDFLTSYKEKYADSFKEEEKNNHPHSVNREKTPDPAPKLSLSERMKMANKAKKSK